MKPCIPFGGFVAVRDKFDHLEQLSHILRSQKAKTHLYPDAGVLLAGFSEFQGQGLWTSELGGVAFDLDLTNTPELKSLVELPSDKQIDGGELIWNLFRKYGIEFVDRLRGAFGFAIWDNESKRLFAVTDFYGIRPVTYSIQGQKAVVASRIKYLRMAGIGNEIDPEAIYHYLFFQAICSPLSIYKSVRKLGPGKKIMISNDGIQEETWYDLKYQPISGKGESFWREVVFSEVEKAVSRFVPEKNDENTGCFLSGGTDSSSVAGLYTKLSGKPAKTFSIGFDDPKYNELDFARMAVNQFGLDQHEYMVTAKDVLDLIEYLPRIYDEPMGNASVVAAYYCAKHAREHSIEVMLGGDGGDEIFGGNERYVKNLVFKRYSYLPHFFRSGIFEPLLNLLPSIGPFHKAKRYVRRANMPNPRRFYSYNLLAEMDNAQIFQPDFLEKIDTDCFFKLAKHHYDNAATAHETDRLLYLDMKFTITDNDLRKVTQMVEAAGLQVHYPLLDRDLVDFSCTIPPQLKVKPGKNRYIFKEAMKGFLPDDIINKTKHGMGLPIAKWLREDKALNELLENQLFSANTSLYEFIRPEYLSHLRQEFYKDTTTFFGDNLWVFLVLELWLQQNT